MAADVLVDRDRSVFPPDRDQGNPDELEGHGVTRLGDVLAEPDPGPIARKNDLSFLRERAFIGVVRIRQPVRLCNGANHIPENSMIHAAPFVLDLAYHSDNAGLSG